MRNTIATSVVIMICVVFIVVLIFGRDAPASPENKDDTDTLLPENNQSLVTMDTLTLSSSAFEHGSKIPSAYTCDGADVSPELAWNGVPEEAQSLVIIMDDPDASRGMWDHWVVFNIPPHVLSVAEAEEPEGTAGVGSSGREGYQGPCPGEGDHRYFFKLYALDTLLPLSEGATKHDVEEAMEGHILAQAELMGRYERKDQRE